MKIKKGDRHQKKRSVVDRKMVSKEEEDISEDKFKNSEVGMGLDNSGEDGDVGFNDDIYEDESEKPNESEGFSADSGVEVKKVLKRKADGDKNKGKNKKWKSDVSKLYRQPTVQELSQWREAENLFHSNLFRLQIQEMLKQVKVQPKYKSLLDDWIENLKEMLENIKESSVLDISNCKWLKKLKVKLPLHKFPHTAGVFKFEKPKSVSVFGSYRNGCCLGPNARVDVKVEVAESCFGAKDYLNDLYHRKRALYLACIAGNLQKSGLVEEMHFLQNGGDPLRPVLELKPVGKIGKRILVVVHLVPPAGRFKLSRFTLKYNNVRPHWYFEEEQPVTPDQPSPTPYHNANILKDLVANSNEEYTSQVLQEHPNLKDGITLLKVWLKQRGLDQGFGGFSGYIMCMYVLYLLQTHRINGLMSSYQVARNTWSILAQSDWTTNGISLASEQSSVSEFHQHFEVVFVDVTGYCNLCANMCKETFLWVKQECGLAVKCLDNPNINSFQALFMTKMPFYCQFDHILRINDQAVLEEIVDKHSLRTQKLDYMGHTYPLARKVLLKLLLRGLQQRVLSVGVMPPDVQRWPVSEPVPPANDLVTIGLILNPDFAFSGLDKGPEANLPEAIEFRETWGKISEVRRFKDGSIAEAVVWNVETLKHKRLVCGKIMYYLLEEKLNIPSESAVLFLADQLEQLIEHHTLWHGDFEYGTGEEATMKVIGALDSLSKQLRNLEDIPLIVSSVQGISPVFRYCDVFPPFPSPFRGNKKLETRGNSTLIDLESPLKSVPRWVHPLEVVIHFEKSGKWPENMEAFRRIKAAFHIKIAEGLSKQFELTVQAYPDAVYVIKDGFVFSLSVANQREVALLKETVTAEKITSYKDTKQSLAVEKKIIHLPKLTSVLHGIHQQYPAFGPACCLAKRWLSSQLLDPYHFPEMCIELLVASLFLSSEPYHTPNQPQLGFFRFLHLMAHTDWNSEPVIINLNGEMNREEILEVENYFRGNRKSLPPLFLSTPYDTKTSIWSKEAPTLQILIRVAMLARETLKLLDASLFSAQTDWKQIFRPPLDAYNVVIHLLPSFNPMRHVTVDKVPESEYRRVSGYYKVKHETIPVVGFNPVYCYLEELRTNYGDVALFFYDVYGGNIITVLWKPAALLPKEFKVAQIHCCKPVDGSSVELNTKAIIEDFSILGSGIVKSVEVQSGGNSS